MKKKQERKTYTSEFKAEVEDMQVYKTLSVVWVYQDGKPASEREIKALRAAGLQVPEPLAVTPGNPVSLSAAAIVIFTFDETAEARQIDASILNALSQRRVPLMFYTQNPNGKPFLLQPEDFTMLKDYPWFMPVNSVMTRVSEVKVLIRR